MFQSARIKLTARYLLIIMVVSLMFSLAIYSGINVELNRFERFQKSRLNYSYQYQVFQNGTRPGQIQRILVPPPDEVDPEIVTHARTRIVLILVIINLSILGFAGIAGYLLAGQTLQPIQDMMNDQNRFITDASHELRTPLTALRSEIEVNLRDKKLKLTDARSLLESNLEEVKNLQLLSDNLIQLTQYQSGFEAKIFEVVSLTEAVDEAVKKVLPLAKAKQITIQQHLPVLQFDGSSELFTELLVILLDNAIKYSDKKTSIRIVAYRADHRVHIEVSDQGNGIEAKDIPFLFDRFYRTDASRTQSETAGYGLGLSIAKQIVEKHHGTISVSSIVGEGSTFAVTLPLKQKK